ncbi:MAG TPA: LLM class flavin-dependent oxidoreductase [Stellaceae bacterium]|jgi:FMN-dependent oxidoreductase (nitrilotriacetate monooxygenase family)|nr:LLM class flavin-dependent oxidoreductase [Stellaceae bacterium]
MAAQNRMMMLIAFLQAQNCSNLPGSWRHPGTMLDFLSPEYYQRIGRTLEDGKIQMAFFDDRLALPDMYTGNHAEAIGAGVRAVKLDPCTVIMAMGMATQRLGLAATYSTTYYEPFHVARVFATMDLMLKGRAAWNIVTSLNSGEARNFGQREHMEHDARYDRADEFMDVVLGHWNTWEDDSLILDKASNRFADPAKVHRLDHDGTYFRSRGPFSVPRSPQGHPVLIQAGQSGRGQDFAAKWADLVFVVYHNLPDGIREYAAFKAALAAAGRDPARVRVAPACYVCVGETETAADEKRAVIEATARDIDALVLLSEVLNYDFAKKPIDEPFADQELAEFSFHGFRDRVIRQSGKKNPTVRDFITVSGRGTVKEHPMFCGNPKQVADQMEAWFTAPACDGFVLASTSLPGSHEDVVRLLVPELQRRGLFHKDYEGPTLRENLGLPIPRAADWHATRGRATE